MKRISLTFILVALDCLFSFSQNSFKPGYIITNDNNLIYGLIHYGDKRTNFAKCVYKKDESADRITYLPDEIKGYRFTNGKYYLSMKSDSNAAKKTFLEYVFDGIVDLYYCGDNKGDHYYISKNNSKLSELRNDLRRVQSVTQKAGVLSQYSENTPTLYEKESKEYIGTLKIYFQDSPNTMKEADNVSLNINSLLKISKNYHNEVCPDEECIIYSKNETRLRFSFGPFIGTSFSNLSITKNTPTFLFDTYPLSTGIFFGAFINFCDPQTSERISLQMETSLFNNTYSSESSSIRLSTFKIPILIKYSIPFKKVQPSIMLGPAYNRFITFESSSDKFESFESLYGNDQFGLCAGLGIDINTKGKQGFVFQVRYEYFTGQHHAVLWDDIPGNVNSNFNNVNISGGYKF